MSISLLPAINYLRCHGIDKNPGQGLITGVKDAGDYRRCHGIDENQRQGFITDVKDTGDNLSLVTPTPVIIYR